MTDKKIDKLLEIFPRHLEDIKALDKDERKIYFTAILQLWNEYEKKLQEERRNELLKFLDERKHERRHFQRVTMASDDDPFDPHDTDTDFIEVDVNGNPIKN